VVPYLGYTYPQGYICLSERIHLRLAIDEKMYLHIIYFHTFIHISVIIIFKNHYTLIVKYIYEKSNYFVKRNFRGTCSSVEMVKGTCSSVEMVKGTCSSVEMVKGTCSSVGMLKWHMVRERLGTPDLAYSNILFFSGVASPRLFGGPKCFILGEEQYFFGIPPLQAQNDKIFPKIG